AAAEEGVEREITLLDGKVFERVLRYARERRPWLLVVGRIGVHSEQSMDLGSNTEQLIRLAPCNVLITSRTFVPPIDRRAEASVVWTPEAEDRMARVPAAARGIARTAVLRWCTQRGLLGRRRRRARRADALSAGHASHRRGGAVDRRCGARDGRGTGSRRGTRGVPAVRLRSVGDTAGDVSGLRRRQQRVRAHRRR